MAVNEIHARFDDDINHEQVKPEEEHCDNDNRCRSNKLVARRPGDLVQFIPHVANELDAALEALSDFLKEFFHRPAIVRGAAPPKIWQARRDSNPQHAVLETAALPIRATGLFIAEGRTQWAEGRGQ